jgi:hypothetical protein
VPVSEFSPDFSLPRSLRVLLKAVASFSFPELRFILPPRDFRLLPTCCPSRCFSARSASISSLYLHPDFRVIPCVDYSFYCCPDLIFSCAHVCGSRGLLGGPEALLLIFQLLFFLGCVDHHARFGLCCSRSSSVARSLCSICAASKALPSFFHELNWFAQSVSSSIVNLVCSSVRRY